MSKTLTLDVSDDVAAFLDTPEALKRLHDFIESEYAREAARLEALRKGTAQAEDGETLSYEDALASSLAGFEQRLRDQTAVA